MHPIDPRRACAELPDPNDPDCSVAGSQAALLLAARLGVLGITERERADLDRAAARGGFELPDLTGMQRDRRLPVSEARRLIGGDEAALLTATAPEVQATMSVVTQALYRAPSTHSAAALFEVGLHSQHPLVRVAAAAGALQTTRQRAELTATLRAGAESSQSLVAALARTALAQLRPTDPVLEAHVVQPPPIQPRNRGSSTAVLTHGTWGAEGTWYQPGGDFYARLDAERPDLHLHDRSFVWSGAYSDAERRVAARQLVDWCAAEGLTTPDLFAHSHGGTVGNLATSVDGLGLTRLVYMGWPVHEEWFPDPSKVARIIDIRVTMDLVILVDRGGQRIRGAPFPVEEHVNGWFDHTSTHEPQYWDEHGLWGVV